MVVGILLESIARAFSATSGPLRVSGVAMAERIESPTRTVPPPADPATVQLREALVGHAPFVTECRWLQHSIAIGGLIGTPENMQKLCAAGVTHVLNLQAEFDDRTIIGDTGIEISWIPIRNGESVSADALRAAVAASRPVLQQTGNRIFVHCLAGQHRAPIFGYALLRVAGMSAEDARATIIAAEPRAQLEPAELEVVESVVGEP